MSDKISIPIFPFEVSDVSLSMALDEALFENCKESNTGFLRIYSFPSPCMTIGYFQKGFKASVPWTRRMTGGGIVEHGSDLVLSFAFPSERRPGRINELYHSIHASILSSIRRFSENALLVSHQPIAKPDSKSYCFISPVQFDINENETKIVGGAICLGRNLFLYQGSLRIPDLKEKADCRQAFLDEMLSILGKEFGFSGLPATIGTSLREKASALKKDKYESLEWKGKY